MIKLAEKSTLQYERLLADLAQIKASFEQKLAQQANTILVEGYWAMGQRVCQEKVFKSGLSTRNGPILKQLAQGLGMEYSLLTRVVKFYRTWPQKCPKEAHPDLSWSHYKNLMSVSDKAQRRFYQKEAQKQHWNKADLAHRIKAGYFEAVQDSSEERNPVKKLSRLNKFLYHYAGEVQRVVDGDTLILDVDLGFNISVELRVRLRGVNTKELDSETETDLNLALKAKAFLEDIFSKDKQVVFLSSRIDLYGRYVADIYYLPGETDKEKIYQNGRFLNQDLVSKGLAEIVV